MRYHLLYYGVLLSFALPIAAQLSKPVFREDFEDIDIIRVNDTFYYSASNTHYFPGAPLLRSYDLLNWGVIIASIVWLANLFDAVTEYNITYNSGPVSWYGVIKCSCSVVCTCMPPISILLKHRLPVWFASGSSQYEDNPRSKYMEMTPWYRKGPSVSGRSEGNISSIVVAAPMKGVWKPAHVMYAQ
ncbi:hypothetical protein BDV09DRAFT_197957 [Aspergillus tetrazonus]